MRVDLSCTSIFSCGLSSRIERISDRIGQLALQSDRVRQSAIVAFRPKFVAIKGVDKRNIEQNAVALPAQSALENMPHAEATADLRQIARARRPDNAESSGG